jgi:hypothetical protein
VRSASARVAANSSVRISERKRTTRTPDTSKSASGNAETQRNNQRSLLEGGVGSFHAPVSALSLNIAIRYEWGKQPHYPSRVRGKFGPWAIRIPVFTLTGRVFDACLRPTTADSLETFTRKGSRFVPDANRTNPTRALRRKRRRPTMN